MDNRQSPRLVLGLALLAAALLRFWALSQGIPFNPGVDEPEVMDRAVRMMKTGDLNPHFFDYPSLYMYLEGAVATLRFLTGAMAGKWASLAQASTEDFYLWGRALTALLGTATVWLVYRAGLRWSGTTALLAAVLLAIMPLHVRESHYALTDVPATFFVMLAFLLSLRAHERATVWSFALAGAAAGLAGATKYNGVLAVLMPLLGCMLTRGLRSSRLICAAWVVAVMLGAFLLAAPYTILDLPHFLNQFARLSSEYRAPAALPEPVWLIYLKHLRNAYGLQLPPADGILRPLVWLLSAPLFWAGSLLVLAGIVFGLWRIGTGPGRTKWLIAIAFLLVYFRFVAQQNIYYGRYLLPLVPFLALLAAAFLVSAIDWLHRRQMPLSVRNAITVAVTIVAIVPPAYTAISYNADAAKTWTQELAYEWILRNIPAGSTIHIEGSTSPKLPATYKVTYVKQLRLDRIKDYAPAGVEYLVASSQCFGPYFDDPGHNPDEVVDYEKIFAQTDEVTRFTADPRLHPGPELRILKVKRSTP